MLARLYSAGGSVELAVRCYKEVVRQNQVGPFQVHAALKLWRQCTGGGEGKEGAAPSVRCLRADYASKLRNKTAQELAALRGCAARSAGGGAAAAAAAEASGVGAAAGGGVVAWASCLELEGPMTGPKQLHKKMEDGAFVWRSMYAAHLHPDTGEETRLPAGSAGGILILVDAEFAPYSGEARWG